MWVGQGGGLGDGGVVGLGKAAGASALHAAQGTREGAIVGLGSGTMVWLRSKWGRGVEGSGRGQCVPVTVSRLLERREGNMPGGGGGPWDLAGGAGHVVEGVPSA